MCCVQSLRSPQALGFPRYCPLILSYHMVGRGVHRYSSIVICLLPSSGASKITFSNRKLLSVNPGRRIAPTTKALRSNRRNGHFVTHRLKNDGTSHFC